MTARKKTGEVSSIEKEIRSEAHWQTIFDSLADAIIILDEDYRITMANAAAAEFLKFPPEKINGNYFFMLMHAGKSKIDSTVAAMLKSNQNEERMLFLEDEAIWARVRTYQPSNPAEPRSRIVHIIRDIGVEKAINGALERRIRELNCLYNLSKLIETKGNSIEDIQEGTLKIIIDAAQYPDIAAAKIVLNNRELSSRNWKTTPWIASKDIVISGTTKGCIQIAYLEEKPEFGKAPFTQEEQNLLYMIAERFSRVVERTRIDALLKEQEEAYRIYFENISDVVFSLTPELKISNITSSVENVLGYKPSELIGKRFINSFILKREYHETAMNRLRKILAGGNAETAEYEFLDKKGNVLIGETHSAPLYQNNKIAGVISVARDITKRHQAEQEIKYINTLLTTQQQTALDGILVVDEKGKIISYNQRFIEIWGLPAEIVESRSNDRALEYVSSNVVNAKDSNAKVRSLYEESDEKTHEEITLKDGRTLDRYSAPMVGEDGHRYGRVWYFRDITQHKKAEN
jgi:PAS domain S-box-containing protein